jgi:hypothetical protein
MRSLRPVECPHEAEVLSAVSTNRWPHRASPELVTHAAQCAICADVVTVAVAFEADSDASVAPPRLPDSAVVWLRAQMRARIEDERTAARPITVVQAIGFAASVGVIGAVFGATATWFQGALGWAWASVKALLSVQPPSVPQSVVSLLATHGLLLAGAIAACVLLAPLAVYLTVRED